MWDWLREMRDRVLGDAVGGPIDREYAREERVLASHSLCDGRVLEVVGVTWGEHHKGESFGISTQSESGLAFHGAAAGDCYHARVCWRVQGWTAWCMESPRRDGVSMMYRTRLRTRDEAVKYLQSVQLETAWSKDRTRVAVRVVRADGAGDWSLVDGVRNEWCVSLTAETDGIAWVENPEHVVWHALRREGE